MITQSAAFFCRQFHYAGMGSMQKKFARKGIVKKSECSNERQIILPVDYLKTGAGIGILPIG